MKQTPSRPSAFFRRPLAIPPLFAAVFAVVFLLHSTLLRLPYFWDEAGYYIPAAWDFFRTGTLIPTSTLTNAHPPLPSILLAAWWKLTGFSPFNTRLLVCLVATAALVAVFRIARLFLQDVPALTVMALTAIYPVWFAQSTLAHADIFAAALTLWALSFHLDRHEWSIGEERDRAGQSATRVPHLREAKVGSPTTNATSNAINTAVLLALASLAKETAILIPATLFALEAFYYLRQRHRDSLIRAASLALTPLPLAAWYTYHHAKTGFTFGNPEYLRYNATANLSLARIALSLWHRLIHLTVHMNLWLPVVATCIILAAWPATLDKRPSLPRNAIIAIATLLTAQWLGFSILGGALLTRYLLPAYPLLLLLCVSAWQRHLQRWWLPAVATLAAFAIAIEVAPPYAYAPEDNLGYRDMIVVQQHAITEIQTRYPGATVLTAWPVSAALERPELGYVKAPFLTARIENFSADQIALAAQDPGRYDTALIFSTKYEPHPGALNLGATRQSDAKLFDFHHDLSPAQVAAALHGKVTWQEDRKGQWAAVLTFPRAYYAHSRPRPGSSIRPHLHTRLLPFVAEWDNRNR